MVKIITKFKFFYPLDKNLGPSWECRALVMRGTATLTSTGPHPILAGCYRLKLTDGKVLIDIQLNSIKDQGTGEELLEILKAPEYAEIYSALVELCRDFQRHRLLGRPKR